MRQWSIYRQNHPKFVEGAELISFIYYKEGKVLREDRLASEVTDENPLPAECLGWWRGVVRRRPPTQKELNDRLEKLFLTLKESTADHKEALQYLVGLYLTRKRILRQEAGAFVHIKSAERFEVSPDALASSQVDSALSELMAVIS